MVNVADQVWIDDGPKKANSNVADQVMVNDAPDMDSSIADPDMTNDGPEGVDINVDDPDMVNDGPEAVDTQLVMNDDGDDSTLPNLRQHGDDASMVAQHGDDVTNDVPSLPNLENLVLV